MNVDINLSGIKDEGFVSTTRSECDAATKDVTDRCEAVALKIRNTLRN